MWISLCPMHHVPPASFALRCPALICFPQMLIPQCETLIFSTAAIDQSLFFSFFILWWRFLRLTFNRGAFSWQLSYTEHSGSFRSQSSPHPSPSYWSQTKQRKPWSGLTGGFRVSHLPAVCLNSFRQWHRSLTGSLAPPLSNPEDSIMSQ